MSTAARRTVTIVYSGDVEGEQIIPADNNADSPGQVAQVVLTAPALNEGEILEETDVEVTVPTGATAVTIVPPGDNTYPIRLKGDGGGDTVGLKLHPTDPTSIALDSSVASFWLAHAGGEAGLDDITVRIFWS